MEDFSLPPELFISMKYIHDNFENISPSIRFKLNYLAAHLLSTYGKEDQGSFFSLIRDEKEPQKIDEKLSDLLSQLENLAPEIATKIYFDTVTTLFPKSQLSLTSLIKKGNLQIRSQTLKLWGERHVLLNYGKQILIIKKTSNRKPDKEMDLNTYTLRWLGDVKSRFCFALDSKTTKNHYKCFFIGSENLEIAREWHENIRVTQNSCYISSFIEHRNKINRLRRSTSPQRHLTEEKKAKKEVKTLKTAKEELEKKKNQALEQKAIDKNLKIPLINLEESDINTIHKNEKERKGNASAPHSTSLFKFDFSNEEEIKNDESPTFKVLQEECSKSPYPKNIENLNFADYDSLEQKQPPCKNLKFGRLYQNSKKFQLLKKLRIKDIKKAPLKKPIRRKKRAFCLFFIRRITNSHYLRLYLPFYNAKLRKELIKLPISRNIIKKDGLFQYLSGNNMNISKKHPEAGFIDYDIRFSMNLKSFLNKLNYKCIIRSENMHLFRNLQRKFQFKEFLSFPQSYKNIIPFFINDKLYENWSNTVISRKILSMNKNNNTVIFYEKRSFFKETLEIVYMRHFFENKDYFIIHDQSIEFNGFQDKSMIIKGDLMNKTIFFDKAYEENDNYTKILIAVEFISKDLLKTLNIKHFFLQEYKDFINLKRIIKERTSYKRLTNKTTIGMKRPLSIENEQRTPKSFLLDEKRFVLFSKKSFSIENSSDLGLIKFLDDTLLGNNSSFELENHITDNFSHIEELLELKNKLKTIKNIKTPLKLILEDPTKTWKYDKNKGLYFTNQKIWKLQNKLIRNLRKSYIGEKTYPLSFINLDFPIIYHDPQTILMKIIQCYIFSMEPLVKASEVNNTLEQMKWIIVFLISLMKYSIFNLFPVNSMMGEVLTVRMKNGVVLKAEMVSINPRQALVGVEGNGFEIKATHEIDYILNRSDLNIRFFKSLEIILKKNKKIQVTQFPGLRIYDLLNSRRTLHFDGTLLFSNNNENLSVVINFGNYSNDIITDEIHDNIPLEKEECWFNGNIFKETPIEEDIIDNEVICFVSGVWVEVIKIDEEDFWNFRRDNKILEEEAEIEGLGRDDWLDSRLGNLKEAGKNYDRLLGMEKVDSWIKLKKQHMANSIKN